MENRNDRPCFVIDPEFHVIIFFKNATLQFWDVQCSESLSFVFLQNVDIPDFGVQHFIFWS